MQLPGFCPGITQGESETAHVGGIARLRGSLDDLVLAGDLEVREAEIRLLGGAPVEVVELRGIRIEGEVEEVEEAAPSLISLDLTVTAERGVFIRGRGLDSEWKLDVSATGNATAPLVSGSLQKIRGQLDLLGKPFDLVHGEISFDGTRDLDPLIDVRLERQTPVQGGVHVGGRISSPTIRFVSRSGLPEGEVLPKLLFGVSRQSLTPAQALHLAHGLAVLFRDGLDYGLPERLRAVTGVDTFRVSGTDTGSSSLTLGKNFGDRVFVGARHSVAGRDSSVVVELKVFENLVVNSELTKDQGSNIGLDWQKDF